MSKATTLLDSPKTPRWRHQRVVMKPSTIAASELADYLDFPYVVTVFTADNSFYVGPWRTRSEAQAWVEAARELASWPQVGVSETAAEVRRLELAKQGRSLFALEVAAQQAARKADPIAYPVDDYGTDQE